MHLESRDHYHKKESQSSPKHTPWGAEPWAAHLGGVSASPAATALFQGKSERKSSHFRAH